MEILAELSHLILVLPVFCIFINISRVTSKVRFRREIAKLSTLYCNNPLIFQIINFIGISGTKAGITEKFFQGTKLLAQRDYQHLFFWEDKCCEKNPGYLRNILSEFR